MKKNYIKLSLFVLFLVSGGPVLANDLVEIIENEDSIIISNGILTVEWSLADSTIRSIDYLGQEMMGSHNSRGYFKSHGTVDGADYRWDRLSGPPDLKVVRAEDEIAEIYFEAHPGVGFPFVLRTHYIMRAGEGGYHTYATLEYPEDSPEEQEVVLELLTRTYRIDSSVFTSKRISDEILEVMPTIEDMREATVLTDETYLMPEGSSYHKDVYTKYDFNAIYDQHRVYGGYGEMGYGMWVISPYNGDMNGAPFKMGNTIYQTDTTVVLLRTGVSQHFGSGLMYFDHKDRGFKKMFGPWFTYFNKSESEEELWSQAKDKLLSLESEWPYQWMESSYYPETWSSVNGILEITDGTAARDTQVLLFETDNVDSDNWQTQGRGYVYSGRVESSGAFSVDHVRPGAYRLVAIQAGVIGEFVVEGIEVDDAGAVDLGLLSWEPERYGKTMWQIGIPDRDSKEFRGGDDFRNWGGYQLERYAEVFPQGVNYHIGQSDWTRDWFYLQPSQPSGGDSYGPSSWTITFDGRDLEGTAYLRLGIAGSRNARLGVILNDEFLHFEDLNSGQGFPRSGSRGYYEEVVVPFDASLIQADANVLVLMQMNALRWSGLHYDFIRMEVPDNSDELLWWRGYPVEDNGVVETSSALGTLNMKNDPWIWVYDLHEFVYLPNLDLDLRNPVGWVYLPKRISELGNVEELDNPVFYSRGLRSFFIFSGDDAHHHQGSWIFLP